VNTVIGKDRYGCATRRQKGACDNGRTITRQEIGSRVLAGLKERLLAPDLVAAFMTAVQGELTKERTRRLAGAGQRAKTLAEIDRRIAGMLRAIEDGLYEPSMKDRMAALRAERETHLAAGEPGQEAQFDILLHPRLPELDRRKVETLEAVLDGPDQAEAMGVIRSMVDRVELRPRADGPGLDAVLQGHRTATPAAYREALSRNAKTPRRWGASGSFGRVGCGDAKPQRLSPTCAI
jgi:site-specific DNA recombinase